MPRVVDSGTIKIGPGKTVPGETLISLGGPGMVGAGPNVGEVLGASAFDPLEAAAKRRVHVLVGEGSGDFETLAEAIVWIGTFTEPPGGTVSGRSWVITVVGPTNETATPIVIPTDGIKVMGAEVRQTGLTQTTIRWNADTPLIDFNGKNDLTFENLAFEYEDTGQGVLATPDRVVFANDTTDAGSLDVSRLMVRNCRFEGNTKAHGFLGVIDNFNSFDHCTFEDNTTVATDFGFVIDQTAVKNCIFRHNTIDQAGTAQSSIKSAILLRNFEGIQDNHIMLNTIRAGFLRGIVTSQDFIGAERNLIQSNRITSTDEMGIHLLNVAGFVLDNNLETVHATGVFSFGQAKKTGLWQEGPGFGFFNNTNVKDNVIDFVGAVTDWAIKTEAAFATVATNRVRKTLEVGDNSIVLANFVELGDIIAGDNAQVTDNQQPSGGDAIVGLAGVVSGNECANITMGVGSRALGNNCQGQINLEDDVIVIGNSATKPATSGPFTGAVFKDNVIANAGVTLQVTDSVFEGNKFGGLLNITGSTNTFTNNQFTAGSLKFTGDRNLVDSNTLLATATITVDGNQNKVEGNDCGFIVDDAVGGGGQNENTVINDNTARGTSLTPIIVKSDGFILSDNWSEGDVTIEGSNGTVSGNYLHTGAVLTLDSSDATVVSNNRLDFGGAGTALLVTTSDDVVINNNIVGDAVNGGDVVITGDNVVVDGNKIFGILSVVGVGPVISDNDPTLITVDGVNAVIEGNKLSVGTPETGTAVAGSASTIQLAAAADTTDDFYNGFLVTITGGTGVLNEARMVQDYFGGAAWLASVSSNWTTPPDATTTYRLDAGVIRVVTSANAAITGNQCTGIDLTTSGGFASVVGNQGAGIVVDGVDDNVIQGNQLSNDIGIGGSARNTIGGNRLVNLTLASVFTNTIVGNHILGEVSVTTGATKVTIVGNHIAGNATTSVALTIAGTDDLVVANNTFGDGMDVVLDGTAAINRLVFDGNRMNATLEGGALTATSTEIQVTNNIMGDLDFDQPLNCLIQGNTLTTTLGIGGANSARVQNNKCTSLSVDGDDSLVQGNIATSLTSNGAACSIQGNTLGTGNLTLGGVGDNSLVQGNTCADIIIDTNALGCSITNNVCVNIGVTDAGAGPAPANTIVALNRVSGLAFGVDPDGTHLATDHNEA